MQNLLIIGGGHYQTPLIEKAILLGYTPFVVAPEIKGDFLGIMHIKEDTRNQAEISKSLLGVEFCGVVTCGSDAGVETVSNIAVQRGLNGTSPISAAISRDKAAMKERFSLNHVPTPSYRVCKSLEDAIHFFSTIQSKAVLKAPDLSGSKGVEVISNVAELFHSWPRVSSMTESQHLVIEEFIGGMEFGADAIVDEKGQVVEIFFFNNSVHSNGFANIPVGHSMPLRLGEMNYPNLHETVQKAANALNAQSTIMNFDFIQSRDGQALVLEVGLRMGATLIPEIIEMSTGIDMYEIAIRLATGDPIDVQLENKRDTISPSMGHVLFLEKKGSMFDPWHLLENLSTVDLEINVNIDYPIGTNLPEMRSGTDRVGQITGSGGSLQILEQNVLDLVARFQESCQGVSKP